MDINNSNLCSINYGKIERDNDFESCKKDLYYQHLKVLDSTTKNFYEKIRTERNNYIISKINDIIKPLINISEVQTNDSEVKQEQKAKKIERKKTQVTLPALSLTDETSETDDGFQQLDSAEVVEFMDFFNDSNKQQMIDYITYKTEEYQRKLLIDLKKFLTEEMIIDPLKFYQPGTTIDDFINDMKSYKEIFSSCQKNLKSNECNKVCKELLTDLKNIIKSKKNLKKKDKVWPKSARTNNSNTTEKSKKKKSKV